MRQELAYDVAIVGGGVYGCAIAYFLSRYGKSVAVLERGVIGDGGATRYSGGIVRIFDLDPVLTDLSLAGIPFLRDWHAFGLPGPSPLHRTGLLYLLKPGSGEQALERIQAKAGDSVQALAPDERRRRFPFLREDHPALALFEPDGGYGDPRLTAKNLATGAEAAGADVIEHCGVYGIDPAGNDEWRVVSSGPALRAGIVVLTAGATARTLVPSLPITVRSIPLSRAQVARDLLPLPVIDDFTDTFVRPVGREMVFCGSRAVCEARTPDELPPYGDRQRTDAMRRLCQLLSLGASVRFHDGILGYDAYTTSLRPIVGFHPDHPGLYLATGFSGRGYKYSVALAEAVAREITGLGRGRYPAEVPAEVLDELRLEAHAETTDSHALQP